MNDDPVERALKSIARGDPAPTLPSTSWKAWKESKSPLTFFEWVTQQQKNEKEEKKGDSDNPIPWKGDE